MSRQYSFACPLPNGVHARAASALEEAARRYDSAVTLVNERTSAAGNAKSVLAIVALDLRWQDPCVVAAEGADEERAIREIARFLEERFPLCDEPLPQAAAAPADFPLPRLLQGSGAELAPGVAAAPGIGRGWVVRVDRLSVADSIPLEGDVDANRQARLLHEALVRLQGRYDDRLVAARAAGAEVPASGGPTPAESAAALGVLKAHRAIARDPEFAARLTADARQPRRTAAGAIASTEAHFTDILLRTGSALLMERTLDIRDVCRELLCEVYGDAAGRPVAALDRDAVCLAAVLTPGQFLALDRRWLRGLVLTGGGPTSHTVILARSFGVPTLVNIDPAVLARVGEQEVIVDADLGVLVTDLTPRARRYYELEGRRMEGRRRRLSRLAADPARTGDGVRVEVGANIGTAAEAAPAFAAGADGIGLFRTEMLFAGRDRAPSEAEQFEEYRQVLQAAGGKPVIIRTLDVGGDKPIPYLQLPAEANPSLGFRAVRAYSAFEQVFRDQVSALLRASSFGALKAMVPMISSVDEVRWVARVIEEEQARVSGAGVPFRVAVDVGVMLEVPAAAFLIDRLSAETAFFSIGTNDLLQYFGAVDRANSRVGHLYTPLAPAFLRLLRQVVHDAHAAGKWVGLCGEMGGDSRALPLLVGLGLDEISMAAPSVPRAKNEVRDLKASECRALLGRACDCATAGEVEELLRSFGPSQSAPLIDEGLVVLDSDARTKEEAIKEAVDRLYVAGRTERPREVEDAAWRREAVHSTGFGYGFAIPHCRTGAVTANSLVLTRLRKPVDWGAADDKPVGVLLLLAVRERDQASADMKILATLTRQLVHEEFRGRLSRGDDPAAVCRLLRGRVGDT